MIARGLTNPMHSRLVRLATLVLPVLALMLLSTLFLVARKVNPDHAIPFATVDVSERARDRQLTMPRFTGVSQGKTAFDLSARKAKPDADDPRKMSAEALRLVLSDDKGGQSTVVSDTGDIDTAARQIVLTGDVRVETSTGYALRTDQLEGSLGRLSVVSPGEVTGDGPLGTLRAGSLRLEEDDAGNARLLFTNGVDLLYTPPS